jgi:hypothetical protein
MTRLLSPRKICHDSGFLQLPFDMRKIDLVPGSPNLQWTILDDGAIAHRVD